MSLASVSVSDSHVLHSQEPASKPVGKGKEVLDTGLKRSRSSSLAAATAPQRVPLGPGRTVAANGSQIPVPASFTAVALAPKPAAASRPQQRTHIAQEIVTVKEDEEFDLMEVEVHAATEEQFSEEDDDSFAIAREIEAMVDVQAEPEFEGKPIRVWPELATERANRYRREIDAIREQFPEEPLEDDMNLVSEYTDEIFEYMAELEVCFYILTDHHYAHS